MQILILPHWSSAQLHYLSYQQFSRGVCDKNVAAETIIKWWVLSSRLLIANCWILWNVAQSPCWGIKMQATNILILTCGYNSVLCSTKLHMVWKDIVFSLVSDERWHFEAYIYEMWYKMQLKNKWPSPDAKNFSVNSTGQLSLILVCCKT